MDAADGVIDGRSFGANVAAPGYGAPGYGAPVYAPGYVGKASLSVLSFSNRSICCRKTIRRWVFFGAIQSLSFVCFVAHSEFFLPAPVVMAPAPVAYGVPTVYYGSTTVTYY